MAVVIDTIQKLKIADDVLKSGRGTPEERAEIQMAMEQARPAIQFAQGFSETGTFDSDSFINMDEGNRNITNEFLKNHSKRKSAEIRGEAVAVTGGLGRGATEVARNAADLIGFVPGAKWISDRMGEHASTLNESTVSLSRDILEKGMGRSLTEEEAGSHAERVESLMQAGETVEKVAIAIAPTRFIGMAKSFFGGIALGTAEGVVTGALTADIDAEQTAEERAAARGEAMTWGAIFGAPVGAITGAFASGRNLIAGRIASTVEEADEGFKLADEFDNFHVTLGQATGDPVIQAAETAASASAAQKFLADQGEKLAPVIAQKLNIVLPKLKDIGAELPATIKNGFKVLDDVITDIKQVRQSAWQKAGKRAIEVGGDTPIMSVRNLQGKMQNIVEQISDRFKGAAEMGVTFRALQKEINQAAARGGATAKEVSDWWLTINTMAESSGTSGFIQATKASQEIAGPQVEALAGQLARTMRLSVDEAADSPAMALLKAQRQSWSNGTKLLKSINDDVLEQLGLGGKVTGQSFLSALDSIPLSNMKSAMDYIRKRPGGTLKIREIQSAIMESAVEAGLKAGRTTPGQSGVMDVTAFTGALADVSERSRLAGVLTDTQEDLAREGIRLARMTLNEGAQQANRVVHRPVTGIENIAINLVSRDPAFMARLLAGALARGKGADWLFYSKEGIEILRTIQPKTIRIEELTTARQAAIVLLTSMTADGAKEKQEEEINAQVGQR